MAKINSFRVPFDNIQFRMYLIPNYKEGQSVFIYKAHHVLTDGLGVSAKFLALSDHYDKNALPAMKPLPFLKNMIIKICLPVLFLKSTLSMIFTF